MGEDAFGDLDVDRACLAVAYGVFQRIAEAACDIAQARGVAALARFRQGGRQGGAQQGRDAAGLLVDEIAHRMLDHRQARPAVALGTVERLLDGGEGALEALLEQLPESLLRSTGRTTMSQPLRDGDRFRQATLDGVTRIETVLNGGEDPGPPVQLERASSPTNIPTAEETENSNAFTWVVVLLVVGTIVPMATWWIFSS